jgi:Tol biopolymer transport system component
LLFAENKERILTRLSWWVSVVGLMLTLVGCGPPAEPTPSPELVATEAPPTETAVIPTATPIPATETPEPETAELIEEPVDASVTGVDSGIISFTNVGDSVDLYALVPGQQPVRMTFAAGLSFGAVWSPSGQRIAYFFVDGATTDTDIWYFDITVGPEPVPVTTGDVAANVKRLSWSADSEFLVYDAPQPDGAESDIYRVAIASGEITNLTEDSADWDASPTWSPDGQWIAFVSDRAEVGQGSDNIWLLDTAEGQVQQLTNSDATLQEDIEPAWSPDGSQIAFLRHSLLGELGDPTSPSGLWLVDVSTGEEELLLEITGRLVGVQPPVWSPNGRWLAYNAPGTADTDIWVVSVEGGEPINVSNLPGEDASISWAPSSRELIFTNSAAGILSQYIVDADGSALGLLVESGQNGLGSWSP